MQNLYSMVWLRKIIISFLIDLFSTFAVFAMYFAADATSQCYQDELMILEYELWKCQINTNTKKKINKKRLILDFNSISLHFNSIDSSP